MTTSPFALHAPQVADANGASPVTARAKPLTRSGVQVAVGNSKRMLRDALAVSGVSQADVAAALGCSAAYVSRRLNDAERDRFNVDDIALFPSKARTAYANLLRAADKAPTGLSDETHLMLLSKESGELCATVVATGADGNEDVADIRRKLSEVADVIARAEAYRSDLAARLAKVSL